MKPKLRVGITCYPTIGGSGIIATELGLALSRIGCEVHFISYEPPFRVDLTLPRVYFHKVKLNEYTLFKYPDYTLPLAVEMYTVHKKFKLDILHVHYAVPHATAALLAVKIIKARNTIIPPKIITTLHGTDITLLGRDKSLKPIICYSIQNSDGITTVSKSLQDDTKKIFSIHRPIEVIYNFYSPKPTTKSRESMRRDLGLRDKDFLVLHISNLRPVKRIPDLLKTISLVSKKHSIKLLILAGSSFHQYLPLVHKYNLKRSVIVKEKVLHIENYLQAADLGFYPSELESFGLGILETMRFGSPIVATKVGGIPEVVENGKSGLLYKVGDIAGFKHGIECFIKDRKQLKIMGENAKVRACNKFSAEIAVHRYLNYYKKILKI